MSRPKFFIAHLSSNRSCLVAHDIENHKLSIIELDNMNFGSEVKAKILSIAKSAVPIRVTRNQYNDILILRPNGSICLWSGHGDNSEFISCECPIFDEPNLKTSPMKKRLRSGAIDVADATIIDSQENFVDFEESGRHKKLASGSFKREIGYGTFKSSECNVIKLSHSVKDRVNFVLRDGRIYRVRITMSSDSYLVSRSLQILSMCLDMDQFNMLQRNFLEKDCTKIEKSGNVWECFTNAVYRTFGMDTQSKQQKECNDWNFLIQTKEYDRVMKDMIFGERRQSLSHSINNEQWLEINHDHKCNHFNEFDEQALSTLFINLHFLYEECKLNVNYHSCLVELGHLLGTIAYIFSLSDYFHHYMRDGISFKFMEHIKGILFV